MGTSGNIQSQCTHIYTPDGIVVPSVTKYEAITSTRSIAIIMGNRKRHLLQNGNSMLAILSLFL